MKTTFKYGIMTYSGSIDGLTYSSFKNGQVCIARRYVKPRNTEQNVEMASTASNIAKLYKECSDEYRADLRTYSHLYASRHVAKDKLAPSSYAIFVQMMHKFQKRYPDNITLEDLVLDDLIELYPELTTVKGAIANGFLKPVSGSDALTAGM